MRPSRTAQVGLGLGGDAVGLGLGADPAEDVVAGRDQDGGQDQGGEQLAEHRPLERQLEHVEADVAVEQGVSAGRRGTRLRHSRNVCQRPDACSPTTSPRKAAMPRRSAAAGRGEHGPGPLHLGAGDHGQAVAGGQPLDHPQVDPDDGRRPQPGQQADERPWSAACPRTGGLVDLPEPQQVGVEARHAADRAPGRGTPAAGRPASSDEEDGGLRPRDGPFYGRRDEALRWPSFRP